MSTAACRTRAVGSANDSLVMLYVQFRSVLHYVTLANRDMLRDEIDGAFHCWYVTLVVADRGLLDGNSEESIVSSSSTYGS